MGENIPTVAAGAWTPDDQQVGHTDNFTTNRTCLESLSSLKQLVHYCSWWNVVLQVYIATGEGGLVVMDVQGNLVTRVSLAPDLPITALVWNCEKFNMEERDDTVNPFVDNRFSSRLAILAVCFKNGKNYKS